MTTPIKRRSFIFQPIIFRNYILMAFNLRLWNSFHFIKLCTWWLYETLRKQQQNISIFIFWIRKQYSTIKEIFFLCSSTLTVKSSSFLEFLKILKCCRLKSWRGIVILKLATRLMITEFLKMASMKALSCSRILVLSTKFWISNSNDLRISNFFSMYEVVILFHGTFIV